MMLGHVRDSLPRVMLSLPGLRGPLLVEFIVDTGFEGELTLPASVLAQLKASPSTGRRIQLADGSQREQPVFLLTLDWNDEPRLTEVLGMEGNPLLGTLLMAENMVQMEMTDGGEVSIESL